MTAFPYQRPTRNDSQHQCADFKPSEIAYLLGMMVGDRINESVKLIAHRLRGNTCRSALEMLSKFTSATHTCD